MNFTVNHMVSADTKINIVAASLQFAAANVELVVGLVALAFFLLLAITYGVRQTSLNLHKDREARRWRAKERARDEHREISDPAHKALMDIGAESERAAAMRLLLKVACVVVIAGALVLVVVLKPS